MTWLVPSTPGLLGIAEETEAEAEVEAEEEAEVVLTLLLVVVLLPRLDDNNVLGSAGLALILAVPPPDVDVGDEEDNKKVVPSAPTWSASDSSGVADDLCFPSAGARVEAGARGRTISFSVIL